ncbi:MAG: CotH kinase family protein, partial [Bacteroidota bacterium]
MKQIYSLLFFIILGFHVQGQSDFYNSDAIQTVRITFEADNWKYLLDSLRYNGEERLAADLSINNTAVSGASVRYRDSRSFTPNSRRNGLFIQLEGNDYQGYSTIDLSSALRDPSLIREVLAREIASSYFHTPAANFANVYINDEYYGLFINIEPIEAPFLTNAYGQEGGHVIYANPDIGNTPPEGCRKKVYGSLQFEKSYDCVEHNFDALQGDISPVREIAYALTNSTASVDKIMDTDAALWMMAFNNVLVNLHSYSGQYANNYYLYRADDKKFRFILGELNLAFGSYKNDGKTASDLRTPQLLQLPTGLHSNNSERPLIKTLLANPFYLKQYHAHIRTILVEWVLSGKLENRAKALQTLISSAVEMDNGKYYDNTEFKNSLTETTGTRSRIPGLLAFMDKRANWLSSNEVYTLLPPVVSEVGVKGRERFSNKMLNSFNVHATVSGFPKKVYVYYRFNNNGPFSQMEMVDDGEHQDGKKSDGEYGAVLTPGERETTV